jgi:ribosomal protein S18 acetylase RimI-like enzyme
MTNSPILIREADRSDTDAIWRIFQQTIAEGTAFVFTPETSPEEFIAYWFGPKANAYVAIIEERVAGSYMIRPNMPGRGSHVANAAYMTSEEFRGRGVGKAMAEHSLRSAKERGYTAMQFNIVVSTNKPAVRLWRSMDFNIIGTVPKAFQHPHLGLVDAYIMHRFL